MTSDSSSRGVQRLLLVGIIVFIVAIFFVVRMIVPLHLAMRQGSSDSRSDEWKNLSDTFMNDLVSQRFDDALSLLDPEMIRGVGGRDNAKAVTDRLFDYCGRPLDSRFQREETGIQTFTSGYWHVKKMRKFFYDTSTTQFPKGICSFSVAIVRNNNGLVVSAFGPLKKLGVTPK